MENSDSKLQFRRSLSSTQVKEQLLSDNVSDVRRLKEQLLSQSEQKFPVSNAEVDDRKTKTTIKKSTLSKSVEFKQSGGQESEACWGKLQFRRVSRDLGCPLDTSKDARGLFDLYTNYDQTRDLDYRQFGEVVVHILESTGQKLSEEDMKTKIEVSWREADRNYNGKVDFDEFAIWYSSWGFQQELLLSPQQILSRDFAKKYDLSIPDVDSVQAKFHLFDEDGSGVIEFHEFEKLLYKLMKVPRGQELPANRLKHFWKEIDTDGSGGVDFEEFLQWYMKYFDMRGNSAFSPIEQLYQSVRPNCGRSM